MLSGQYQNQTSLLYQSQRLMISRRQSDPKEHDHEDKNFVCVRRQSGLGVLVLRRRENPV
jgi:hypothetical protein